MCILVVDDDADSAASQTRLLGKRGYDAHACLHGNDALEMIERLRPDVLLLDLSMPEMSGFDIADELRDNPDLRPRCLVAVTGSGQAEDRAKTREAGFDFHLVKPVAWDKLQAIFDDLCVLEGRAD